MTLEEERRGAWEGGQLQTEWQTAVLSCPWEEALLPAWAGRRRGSAGGRGGECGVPVCPLPASAPSPVSLQLPKRQLLIPAVGASVLCSEVSAFFSFAISFLFGTY